MWQAAIHQGNSKEQTKMVSRKDLKIWAREMCLGAVDKMINEYKEESDHPFDDEVALKKERDRIAKLFDLQDKEQTKMKSSITNECEKIVYEINQLYSLADALS